MTTDEARMTRRMTKAFEFVRYLRLVIRHFVFCCLVSSGCERHPDRAAPHENQTAQSQTSQPGPQWFSDITGPSALRFTHVAGTNYFMPDQVGSGIALFDYDNDGRLDL